MEGMEQVDNYSILTYLNQGYETVTLQQLMDDLLLGEIDNELLYLKENNLVLQFDESLTITNPGRKIVRQLINNLKMSESTKTALEEKGEHYLITDLRVQLNEASDKITTIQVMMDIILIAQKIDARARKPLFSKLIGILANIYSDEELDLMTIPPEVGFYLKLLQDIISDDETDIMASLEIKEEDLDEEEVVEIKEALEVLNIEMGDNPWQKMASDDYLRYTMIKELSIDLDKEELLAYMLIREAAISDSISLSYLVNNKLASAEIVRSLADARLIDCYDDTVNVNDIDLHQLIENENLLVKYDGESNDQLKTTEILVPESKDPCISSGFKNIIEGMLAAMPVPGGAKKLEEKPEEIHEITLKGSQVLDTMEELEGIYRILCGYHINNSISSTDEIAISRAKQKELIIGNGNLELTNKGREVIITEILP